MILLKIFIVITYSTAIVRLKKKMKGMPEEKQTFEEIFVNKQIKVQVSSWFIGELRLERTSDLIREADS